MGQIAEEIVPELTTQLYYDLLDKHIQLKERYAEKKRALVNAEFQLLMWRTYASTRDEDVKQAWNKLMDKMRSMVCIHGEYTVNHLRRLKKTATSLEDIK